MEATEQAIETRSSAATKAAPWRSFRPGPWQDSIDVRDFIQRNYSPYEGDGSFVSGPTERTRKLWQQLSKLLDQERAAGGVLDADDTVVGTISSHAAGYINRELEQIVGVQTDAPLKRAMLPYGGLRVAAKALQSHGREMNPEVFEFFEKHRRTHNDGVFDCYTEDIRNARRAGIVTGLPDGYGRGRIIGDYRRVALYGIDRLIADKQRQLADMESEPFSDDWLREREELSEQVRALHEMIVMARSYDLDISRPARTAQAFGLFLGPWGAHIGPTRKT